MNKSIMGWNKANGNTGMTTMQRLEEKIKQDSEWELPGIFKKMNEVCS